MALDRLTKVTGPGIKTDTNWVGNNANFTGITTTGSSFNVGVSTFHSTLAEVHNIKSTGIITATGGSFSGNVTAVDGTFSGNVSIAGTLTYEDVTNIDSVGIITAPALDVDDFLDVGSNIKLGNAGVVTATSFTGSGANLTSLPAGQLTGTVADARISTLTASKLSGALPAISGANLTNLDASDLASGTVPTARLGSGTANSSTFLRGDSTFAAVTSTTINNNAANRIITGEGGTTLNGEANLTYDGNDLIITGAIPSLKFTESDGNPDYQLLSNNGIFKIHDVTNSADRFAVNTNGTGYFLSNFQIGSTTTSPGATLHIKTSYPSLKVDSGGHASDAYVRIISGNAQNSRVDFGDSDDDDIGMIDYDHANNSMRFLTNTSERLRIDSSGRLLVATNSASAANSGADDLVIGNTSQGNNGMTIVTNNANIGGIYFADQDNSVRGGVRYQHGLDLSQFYAGGSVVLNLKNKGAGINETSPTADALVIRGGDTDDTPSLILKRATDGTQSAGEIIGKLQFTSNENNVDSGNYQPRVEIKGETTDTVGGAAMVFSTAAGSATSPTERLRITSGGTLAINKSSGNYGSPLHIIADASENAITVEGLKAAINWRYTDGSANRRGGIKWNGATGQVLFDSGVSGNGYYYQFDLNGSERLRIKSDGKIEVPTTGKLSLGMSSPVAQFTVGPTNGSTNIEIEDYGVIRGYDRNSGAWSKIEFEALNYIFDTSGSERLRIDSSGRVGINRTPSLASSKLEVGGADNYPLINVEASGATAGLGVGNSALKFYYGTSLKWRITSNGELYPEGNFKIGLNSNTAFRMNEVNSEKFVHRYGTSGSATNNQQEAIWYGGGITVMHDYQTLQTTNYTWGLTGNRGYPLIRIRNANNAAIYAEAGGISSGSDYRMKENIEEITNGIETVKKLKPSKYNIRKSFNPEDDGTKHHGFIAHEVQEAIPDIGNIVTGTKDGMEEVFYHDDDENIPEGKKAGDSTGTFTDKPDMQGIDYGHMTPVLAAAIKELITKVETLEAEVAALKAK